MVMATIKINNETDLIKFVSEIGSAARELRFWDNYSNVNGKDYGKEKSLIYMKQLDALFKKLNMNNAQRLNAIKIIIQTDKL